MLNDTYIRLPRKTQYVYDSQIFKLRSEALYCTVSRLYFPTANLNCLPHKWPWRKK